LTLFSLKVPHFGVIESEKLVDAAAKRGAELRLTIAEEDCNWIARAFEVIASSHKVPGAIWSLGKTLVENAVRRSA